MKNGFFFLTWFLILSQGVMGDEKESIARIDHDGLRELSGMTSAKQSGEFWGINDSKNFPNLYRFNREGQVLQVVTLVGAQNVDWEAISRDSSGSLYIADIGDNEEKFDTYTLYKIAEPGIQMKRTNDFYTYYYQYEGKKSHNAEAFFLYRNRFYIITKEYKNGNKPFLYRIDSLNATEISIAKRIGELQIEGKVTDACFSLEHNHLAVLTEKRLYSFSIVREKDFLRKPMAQIEIDDDECEGIAFDDGHLVMTNEDGKIWIYTLSELTHP